MTQRLETDPAQVLARLQNSYWFDIGRRSARAHLARKHWLYRRVESLEFVGRRSLRRHVSVDFEMPRLPRLGDRAPRNGRLVPVSVFAKWPPLSDFDFVGPDGLPCSLYVRDTNKQLDLGLLLGMAAPLARLTPGLRALLALLVDTDQPPTEGVRATIAELWGELRAANPHADLQRTRHIADTVNLAAQLANSSILWVPVTAARGSDCIVKFSYLDVYRKRRSVRQALIACSWLDRGLYIPLPHAGQYTRYHLDVDAASAAIELVRAQTIAFPGEPERDEAESRPRGGAAARQDDRRSHMALGSAKITDRHAHIYHPLRTSPSHRVLLQLVISATREGFISSCLIFAVALAVLMSLAYSQLPDAAGHLEPFVVLLAAVPLILGYMLVRSESPLEREGVIGVRAMALFAGLMPIAGALVLVFASQAPRAPTPDLRLARPAWAALTITSWLLALGLAWSWALACSGRERTRDHRPANIALASGIFAAVCIAAGALVDWQPYVHVSQSRLASYLPAHRPTLLLTAALLTLGVSALHPVAGAIRRSGRKSQRTCGRAPAEALMLAAAGLLIWGTILAAVLTAWQTITPAQPHEIRVFMRGVDALSNAILIPAALFVVAATTWLIAFRTRGSLTAPLLLTGALLGIAGLGLRGAAVAFPGSLSIAPSLAWIGLAAWILCATLALRHRAPRA